MHISVRVRVFLARHRWVYWVAVGSLAATIAVLVHAELRRVEHARAAWDTTSEVVVAIGDQHAGSPPRVERRLLPKAMIPEAALSVLPEGATLRQRVADDEVLTSLDISARPGPVGGAEADSVVVGIIDPLALGAVVGSRVRVTSEGIVLAESGEVVTLTDDVVFVAVDAADGPMIAAAAQAGLASIIFVP